MDRWPAMPVTLTGSQALTFTDAAALLTAELGRPIRYRRQSLWQRRSGLRAGGAEKGYVTVQLVIDVTTRFGLARKVTHHIPASWADRHIGPVHPGLPHRMDAGPFDRMR